MGIKIGIAGITGRMGRTLAANIDSYPSLVLAGGSTLPGTPGLPGVATVHTAADLFALSDVVIDFSAPEATRQHIWQAAKAHKALVIGTTGLSDADKSEMADAAREAPILFSANMSLGVNVLAALVEKAAAALPEMFDIEVVETHHKMKVDAPSGTALMLGHAAAQGRRYDPQKAFILSREGHTGPRPDGTIGFATLRGGDVTGDHTVGFFGPAERIELTHKSTDRAIFARGALQAACWIAGKPPGLYSMKDVLGL